MLDGFSWCDVKLKGIYYNTREREVILALMLLYKRRWDFLCSRTVSVPLSCAKVVQRSVSELKQPLRSSWRCSSCPFFADWSRAFLSLSSLGWIKASFNAEAAVGSCSRVLPNQEHSVTTDTVQETSYVLPALWCEFSPLFICVCLCTVLGNTVDCPCNSPAPPGGVALAYKGKRKKNTSDRLWKNPKNNRDLNRFDIWLYFRLSSFWIA